MRLIPSRVKRKLKPRQIAIPRRMIAVVISNLRGTEVAIKTLRMVRFGIIRSSGDMVNTKTKTGITEQLISELTTIIGNQITAWTTRTK